MSTATETRKSIGEAAKETGLRVHTLWYYERSGLICRVLRGRSGRREHTDEDIEWFVFLRRLRTTGMPIRVMREFGQLRQQGGETLLDRFVRLVAHRDTLVRRIAELSRMREYIETKVRDYEEAIGSEPGKGCS
jgi:DNA-binding transcriptional MerR regulator